MNNNVLFIFFKYIYLLVVLFALLHSSIACHKLVGINIKEKKKTSFYTNFCLFGRHLKFCEFSSIHINTMFKYYVLSLYEVYFLFCEITLLSMYTLECELI